MIVANALKIDLSRNGGFVNTFDEALGVIAKVRTQQEIAI